MNRILISLIAVATLVAGCSRRGIEGDGVIKAEDRPVPEFSKIVVTGGYEIEWTSGKPGLKISTDQNLLAHIRTVVTGDSLEIDTKENLAPTKTIVITMSSAYVANVRLTGGISFKASQINGQDLHIEAVGASQINVSGAVTNLSANLTGASKLDAKSLQAQKVTISLTGASDADVNASDALKIAITGSGSLTYAGNPKSMEQSVTGTGNIRRRE